MDVLAADWLQICRRIVAAQGEIFAAAPGAAERGVYEGVGEGGDRALAIDRRCEDAVFAELEALAERGASFLAVSEERGEVRFGDGAEVRVVIDPIDGSLNARRTIPSHSFSLAVAAADSMAAVEFGFVHDFGAGEEFSARRGEGAFRNGTELAVTEPAERLEVVGVESAEPRWALPALTRLGGAVYRLRVVGSIAISACYVAAGRFDGMLSLRSCRSVDAAAAQLIVREAGGTVGFGEPGLERVPLGLDARYPIVAARDETALATLADAQRA